MFFITEGNELQQYSLKSLGDVYLAIFWVKIWLFAAHWEVDYVAEVGMGMFSSVKNG